ncbi:hypothetical protein LCM08_06115 [Salipiger pacificus]|nr:hypothetical protein [Alloyangia pacifica]
MAQNWKLKVKSLNCRIVENATDVEVEVVQTIAEGVDRVKERLTLTLAGRFRDLDEALNEAATAKVAEMAGALGLEG